MDLAGMIGPARLSPEQVLGNYVPLQRSNAAHLAGPGDPAVGAADSADFGRMLFDGLNEVSSLEQTHADLSVQAVVDPDSVHPHDITIAASKANLALSLTRNVVDRVIQAYREITTLR